MFLVICLKLGHECCEKTYSPLTPSSHQKKVSSRWKNYPLRLHYDHFIMQNKKNECPLSVCACVKNKHRTHTSAWPLPKTPGVKVGNTLRWQQPFVSKYISKVSNFCGNTEDGGIVHVKLELRLGGRCGCLHRTNATWTFFLLVGQLYVVLPSVFFFIIIWQDAWL